MNLLQWILVFTSLLPRWDGSEDGEDVRLLPRTPELRRVANPAGLLRRWF